MSRYTDEQHRQMLSMLRRLEFGEAFTERGTVRGGDMWQRECPICGARVAESEADALPVSYAARHAKSGCELAALLDRNRAAAGAGQ